MLLMKTIDGKQTMGDIRVKYMYPLSPFQGKTGIVKERDENSYKYATVYFDDGIIDIVHKSHLIEIESEKNDMAKLEAYYAVAAIKQGYYNKSYYYGIYNDGYVYKKGDKVVVSGGCSEAYYTIDEILTIDEAKERFRGTITAEIICKIDTSAYDKRVEERNKVEKRKKEAAKIKKQMDKMVNEMDKTAIYEMYAKINPELMAKLEAYKELVKESK